MTYNGLSAVRSASQRRVRLDGARRRVTRGVACRLPPPGAGAGNARAARNSSAYASTIGFSQLGPYTACTVTGYPNATDRGHESRRGNLASRAFRLRTEAAPLPIAASAGTPRRFGHPGAWGRRRASPARSACVCRSAAGPLPTTPMPGSKQQARRRATHTCAAGPPANRSSRPRAVVQTRKLPGE